MTTKITTVEDDPRLSRELQKLLLENDYQVHSITDFHHIPDQIAQAAPDLILLDINLPNLSGERILRKIRETSQTPIIMLTSRSTEADEIISMSYGADDFITKPFVPQILLLRIEAILSRTRNTSPDQTITHGGLELHPLRSTATSQGKEVTLTRNELIILSFLIKHHGKIVSRADLIDHLWDDDEFVDDNTLTVNITRLRDKLATIGQPDLVETRRSQGYIIS